MKAWLWNGAAFEPASHLPLTDRGLRYGMSLFESFRVAGGAPWFWPRHAALLRSSLAGRGFFIDDRVLDRVPAVLAESGLDGFGRLCITAGDGGLSAPVAHPRALLTLEPRAAPGAGGIALGLHGEPYAAPFGGLKTGNYWFNADALALARRDGFHEALLFNHRGEIVSACCANVFLVHGGLLSTPPRESGAREGSVRGWLIEQAPVEVRPLTEVDIFTADEIFLTNSWFGVRAVCRCGPRGNLPPDSANLWLPKVEQAARE